MADVFISYAREDHDVAARFAELFENHGWSVWWDRELVPGESFDEVIEQELTEAKAVIVLWSAVSVQSRWVRSEANAAVERGNLIPVTVDGTPTPLRYRIVQAVDLVGWDRSEDDPRFASVCAGVLALAGPPPPPLSNAPSSFPQPVAPEPVRRASVSVGAGPEHASTASSGPSSESSSPGSPGTPPPVPVTPVVPNGERRSKALLLGLAALAVAALGVAAGVVVASGSGSDPGTSPAPPAPTSGTVGQVIEVVAADPTTTTTAAEVQSAPAEILDGSTTTAASSPPTPLVVRELLQGSPVVVPFCVGASGRESNGNPVSFDPSNLVDGQPDTAWRCDGNLVGTELTFVVPRSATITAIGLSPGYAKIDPFRSDLDRFFQNRRITSVTWTCRVEGVEVGSVTQQLDPDVRLVQQLQLAQPLSCDTMALRIDGVTEPGANGAEPRDYTAISEVSIRGWTP